MICLMRRFGPFEISNGELSKTGIRVRIQDQPLRILETLLERPGELVTREELRDRLWPSDTFVDFERGLNAGVAKLRQCLSDSAEQPLYIQTIARKGYRFIAPVTGDARTEELLGLTPHTVTTHSKWLVPLLVATTFLAIGLVIAIAMLWRTSRSGVPGQSINLDLDVGENASQPSISADGTRIVFVSKGSLAIRRLEIPHITPLPGTEGASLPFFSPDAKWVGFFADRKLKKVLVEGGSDPVILCDAPWGGGGSWGEDGYIVAGLQSTGGLSRLPDSGGAPQQFTTMAPGTPGETTHRAPHILPEAKGVLFIAGSGAAVGSLQVWLPQGRASKTLIKGSTGARYLPSGHLVYHQGGSLFAAAIGSRSAGNWACDPSGARLIR